MKLGTTELIVILIVVIIIFGPTQIPKLTKMFGKSVKGFKEGMEETEEDVPAEKKKSKKSKTAKAEVKADEDTSDEEES
ncbi:MAG: twin-arginine translocase TatA/TatE family subunit [Oscillospiraceae bacterium]|nr:twin-arginine translocase TatA/TatE family subunit [Oscillospiraceae bacterium]